MIAYVILSMQSAENVIQLVSAIYRTSDVFLIHMDKKAAAGDLATLTDFASRNNNIYLMKPRSCAWGSFSLVNIVIDCIEFLLDRVNNWGHVILLSEHHYPLRNVEYISGYVQRDTSYMDVHAYESFPDSAKADIAHRFSRVFREMEGIGSFGEDIRSVDLGKIHHASQWVVLSRIAAKFIGNSFRKKRHEWYIYETSLLPDEIAFPSILTNAETSERGQICEKCLTYVAWPHRTDNPHLIASARSFDDGRKDGALFIRKRPAVFEGLEDYLIQSDQQPERNSSRASATVRNESLASELIEALGKLDRNIDFRDYENSRFSATTQFSVRRQEWDWRLSLMVLSANNSEFRVLLLAGPATGPKEVRLGRFDAYVLKVRLVDVQEHYCLAVDRDLSAPFSLSTPFGAADIKSLSDKIRTYLKIGDETNSHLLKREA